MHVLLNQFLATGELAGLIPGFLTRLVIDLVCVSVLVRLIYYRYYKRTDLFLTFYALNIVVFLITLLLNRVEMTMGAAFGLFAVFSMLRYRTEGISAKDMTYLFLVIGLGLLMAVAGGGPVFLASIGAVILLSTYLLEGSWLAPRELAYQVLYDNVALVHAGSRAALIADLRERTGLDVQRVDVQELDYVRDAARLTIYYHGD